MLLTAQAIPAVYNGTAMNANLVEIEGSLLDLGTYIISGLTFAAGTGLSVNVALGIASIGGRVTVAAPFVITGLANGTLNHLWLLNTGGGTSNTTGTPPANSTKLGTATTAGGVVTSVNEGLTSGRQQFIQPSAIIHGGGATGLASAGHPRGVNLADWAAAAAEGIEVYGTLPAAAVAGVSETIQIKTTDYTLVYTDDIIFADATAGLITMTLPTAAGHDNQQFEIKRINTNANHVHINTTAGQGIEFNAPPYDMAAPGLAIRLAAKNNAWWAI